MVLDQRRTYQAMLIFTHNGCKRLPDILLRSFVKPVCPICTIYGSTIPYPCFPVIVGIGSNVVRSTLTTMIALNDKGSGLSKTNFFNPLAILSIVFCASGRTARMPYFL